MIGLPDTSSAQAASWHAGSGQTHPQLWILWILQYALCTEGFAVACKCRLKGNCQFCAALARQVCMPQRQATRTLQYFESELAIISHSLTSLYLHQPTEKDLPDVSRCTSLQHVTLVLASAPAEFRFPADHLPAQLVTLRVKCESQQQLLVQPGSQVQVQFVEVVSLDQL